MGVPHSTEQPDDSGGSQEGVLRLPGSDRVEACEVSRPEALPVY